MPKAFIARSYDVHCVVNTFPVRLPHVLAVPKSGSKAGKDKGTARPMDPSPVESSHVSSNDDKIIISATSENKSECGTVVTVNMPGDVPSDENHSNAIPQPLHQRKKSKITTSLSHDTDTCITFSNRSCRLQPRPPHDKVVVVTLVRRPAQCVPIPFRAYNTTSPIVLNMSKTIGEVWRSVRILPSSSSYKTFPSCPLQGCLRS